MRYELKFLLTYEQYFRLKNTISQTMMLDLFGLDYPVFSTYLDTKDLSFYYDKVDGYYYHIKTRLRKYSFNLKDSSPLFMEAKMKKSDLGLKYREKTNLKYEEALNVNNWNAPLNTISYMMNLYPIVNVFYIREAYISSDNLRITFDKDITALTLKQSQMNENLLNSQKILNNNFCLMEIKYYQKELPNWLKILLRNNSVEQTSFSKYTECYEFLKMRGIYGI